MTENPRQTSQTNPSPAPRPGGVKLGRLLLIPLAVLLIGSAVVFILSRVASSPEATIASAPAPAAASAPAAVAAAAPALPPCTDAVVTQKVGPVMVRVNEGNCQVRAAIKGNGCVVFYDADERAIGRACAGSSFAQSGERVAAYMRSERGLQVEMTANFCPPGSPGTAVTSCN